MRFGHCKTCWWWKLVESKRTVEDIITSTEKRNGFCFMYSNRTEETSYCPDHTNRKKYNKEWGQTLDEWIEEHKNTLEIL